MLSPADIILLVLKINLLALQVFTIKSDQTLTQFLAFIDLLHLLFQKA